MDTLLAPVSIAIEKAMENVAVYKANGRCASDITHIYMYLK
jgi:hypothetical protein